MRSVLVSLVWAGLGSIVLSGCGQGLDSRIPVANTVQTPAANQRNNGAQGTAPSGTSNPELTVTAITHLMTIESDVAGRGTMPVLFNVELMVDAQNSFQLLNVHRQGTTRPALPPTGLASAGERARICADNSAASQENCDVDLRQLSGEGVVIERFLGRAGVILKAADDFSPTTGGRLTLHYIQRANLTDSSLDVMADYSIQLQHVNGQWLLLSSAHPDKGPFSLMKLESNFAGLFASSVKTIQVGTSEIDLW